MPKIKVMENIVLYRDRNEYINLAYLSNVLCNHCNSCYYSSDYIEADNTRFYRYSSIQHVLCKKCSKKMNKIIDIYHNLFDKVNSCENSTILLKNGDLTYYKLFRCKELSCPKCSLVALENLSERLTYVADIYNFQYFYTMTSRAYEYDKLNYRFEKTCEKLKTLNKESYISWFLSKNKSKGYGIYNAELSYQEFISECIIYEIQCYFLYDMEVKGGKLYNDFSIKVSKLINNFKLLHWLQSNKEHFPTPYLFKKVYSKWEQEQKKYFGRAFESLEKSEKYSFFNTFKDFYLINVNKFIENYKTKNPESYQLISEKLKNKVVANTDKEFVFVRVLEYAKEGRPHFHILSNFYFNRYIVDLYKSPDSFIDENKDFSDSQRMADDVTEYIIKYVTKHTLENNKLDKVLFEKTPPKVISSSKGKNFELYLNYDNKDDYEKETKLDNINFKFLKKINNKIPPKSWGIIDGDIKVFEDNLIDTRENNKNTYISIIHYCHKKVQEKLEKNKRLIHDKKEFSVKKKEMLNLFDDFKIYYASKLIYSELERRKHVQTLSLEFKNVELFNKMNDLEQKEFVSAVASDKYNIIILRGGAGTGKTTSLKSALECLDFTGVNVEFCAFTGKAVSRIMEVTGFQGKTIHRLANSTFSKLPDFLNSERNLLDADIVFVDELSMIDKMVFSAFINCLKVNCKIVLVGDPNQLNPVNSNNLFYEFDLIKDLFSGIKLIELKENYRSTDNINKIAMDVLKGEFSHIPFEKFDINKVVDDYLNGYQILSNSNNTVSKINRELTKNKRDITNTAKYHYNIGDLVLILRNDTKNNIFNGDMAIILDYTGKMIKLQKAIWNNGVIEKLGEEFWYSVYKSSKCFQPYSCFTIHKSQGSEFSKVSVVFDNKSFLLNKNILYTAVTRAKDDLKLYIVDKVDVALFKKGQENLDSYTLREETSKYFEGSYEVVNKRWQDALGDDIYEEDLDFGDEGRETFEPYVAYFPGTNGEPGGFLTIYRNKRK